MVAKESASDTWSSIPYTTDSGLLREHVSTGLLYCFDREAMIFKSHHRYDDICSSQYHAEL
jgi:hypothetical protein